MRNAQFSHPLGEIRVKVLLARRCDPIAFDYERAEIA
jgi:hypothetical protein